MTAVTNVDTKILPQEPAILFRKQMGEAANLGDLVYLKSDGKLWKTDSDDAAKTEGMIGIVVSGADTPYYKTSGAVAADEWVDFVVLGVVDGFSGLTKGAKLYVSATAGAIDDAAGTVARTIGFAFSDTQVFVYPEIDASS
jgi:hypothetical protein